MKKSRVVKIVVAITLVIFCLSIITVNKKEEVYYRDYILEIVERNNKDYDKAIDEVNKNLEKKNISDKELGLNLLARQTYYYMGLDEVNFEKNYLKTETILKENNMVEELVYLYSMVTSYYISNYEYEKAYVYINESEFRVKKLYLKYKDEEDLSTLIAIMYLKANLAMSLDLETESVKTFNEAEALRMDYTGRERLDIYINIASYYNKKEDYKNLEKYTKKCIDYLENQERVLIRIDSEEDNIYIYNYVDTKILLATAYLKQGELDKCIEIVDSIKKYDNIISKNIISNKYKLYSKIYLHYGDVKNSLEYLELAYNKIKDSKNIMQKIEITSDIIKLGLEHDDIDTSDWNKKLVDLYEEYGRFYDRQFLLNEVINSDINAAENQIKNLKLKEIILEVEIVAVFILLVLALVFIKNLYKKNIYDNLTKIYNRSYFNKVYNRYLYKKRLHHLIIFDIDNFKNINDTYGHKFGDVVLEFVANELLKLNDKNIKAFRYGGEEFVLLVTEYNTKKTLEIAEEIRASIEALKWKEDVVVTISVGVSCYSNSSLDTLKLADDNLYKSKKSGKNRITFE